MSVPKNIRLGAISYSVQVETTAEDAETLGDNFGKTKHREQRIILAHGQAPDCLVDTALHEALHMCWFQGALPDVFDQAVEETVIRGLTPNVLALLRQNPRLVTFLIGKEE